MHAKFNLNPGNNKWTDYVKTGRKIHHDNKAIVESDLEIFKNANSALEANKIIDNWFPRIRSDVFLSHSHKDEELILGLAGWLKSKFNINSFIDSAVWGYSDDLIKILDNKYCKNGSSYNYNARNRSTSHVHMMLSTALMDMIDQCECIIFVNTPSSFKPIDYLNDQGKTESPWIYSEIAMTRMLRQKSPEEHRPQPAFESATASTKKKESLKIEYPLETFHLTNLSVGNLNKWLQDYEKIPAYAKWSNDYPLDCLYNIMKKK